MGTITLLLLGQSQTDRVPGHFPSSYRHHAIPTLDMCACYQAGQASGRLCPGSRVPQIKKLWSCDGDSWMGWTMVPAMITSLSP